MTSELLKSENNIMATSYRLVFYLFVKSMLTNRLLSSFALGCLSTVLSSIPQAGRQAEGFSSRLGFFKRTVARDWVFLHF
jgi:hypothetical protein